jgi:hypothetical protein
MNPQNKLNGINTIKMRANFQELKNEAIRQKRTPPKP